ncbi:hypothetical protein ACSBPU_11655 [Parapusillimonas sp. JC17]|uniref:hypothetical protein n=1 Tax=Parapusillimonas sp. JC17 TaxID=3445768 RepID=UPI003FA10E47
MRSPAVGPSEGAMPEEGGGMSDGAGVVPESGAGAGAGAAGGGAGAGAGAGVSTGGVVFMGASASSPLEQAASKLMDAAIAIKVKCV